MKSVIEFRKILGTERGTSLVEMKTIYRNLMKESHPDKFVDDEVNRLLSEHRSKDIIEAYHFLVSISPETAKNNIVDYTESISNVVVDFQFNGKLLCLEFSDGNSYEYFGVSKDVYMKLCQSNSRSRFVRRKICNVFTYRKITKQSVD